MKFKGTLQAAYRYCSGTVCHRQNRCTA